jgi:hypothetical protein
VNGARLLTDEEFGQALRSFEHTAFRLELQGAYSEPSETALLAAFLSGDSFPATEVSELRDWYENVAAHVREGKRVERVRVQQEPPTNYQRFERWLDQWNLRAGEVIRYLSRERAHEIGLLPAAGDRDWWLLDSARLIVMRFDGKGHRIENELVTDPVTVLQACKWRDLAVHHSVQAHLSDVTA